MDLWCEWCELSSRPRAIIRMREKRSATPWAAVPCPWESLTPNISDPLSACRLVSTEARVWPLDAKASDKPRRLNEILGHCKWGTVFGAGSRDWVLRSTESSSDTDDAMGIVNSTLRSPSRQEEHVQVYKFIEDGSDSGKNLFDSFVSYTLLHDSKPV